MVFSALRQEPPPQPEKPLDLGHVPAVSFHDKVLGNKQALPMRENVDLLEKKLARIEFENGNRLLPKVFLHESVINELCTPW